MSGLRKWIKRDRYAIVRGSIVLALLLALCAAFVGEMLNYTNRTSVEVRAEDTTNRVVAQFEQMLRYAFIDLSGAAKVIQDDPSRTDIFLQALYEYNVYTEVGVLRNGVIRHRDGSTNSLRYNAIESSYAYMLGGESKGRFLALHDGSVLLCSPIDGESELAARYDPDALEDILGASFKEDYDFAVYNASTGTYLVNHTSFAQDSYYDALLALNEGGSTSALLKDESAIAHIDHYEGGVYIAQQRSSVRPWNVVLVIPETATGTYGLNRRWTVYAVVGLALLVLAVHLCFTVVTMRRVGEERRASERALQDSARMLGDMAHQAQVTLFIYHRGQESLMNCYDGLGLLGDAGMDKKLSSLSELEAACGLQESETERLHDRLNELRRGDSAELTLRSVLPDREERMLRVELQAHAADGEVIVCSLRDCTQEMASQNRAEIEQSFLENTIQRTVAVWEINVSRNLWHNLYMKDPALLGPLGEFQDAGWRDFTADLGGALRDYLYPVDYADHVQQMSVPAIAEAYRSGRTEFDMDYRVCTSSMENYVWHRMHVRIYAQPETGDILANIYVFNVDVEKNAELERGERKKVFKKTLRALSGIYYALYYVDLDNDLCYAAKSYDGEVVTKLSMPFRETFDKYLEAVHPNDREELRNMLDPFVIRRTFNENSRFQRREYQRSSGDGEYRWAAIILQPARYENGRIKDIVIAMRHLSNQKHELDLE